jgi:hypothetical protein
MRWRLTATSRGFPRGPFATSRQASRVVWSRQHSKRLTRSGFDRIRAYGEVETAVVRPRAFDHALKGSTVPSRFSASVRV